MKNGKSQQRDRNRGPNDPFSGRHALPSFNPHIPEPKAETDGTCDIEIIRDRLSNEALFKLGAKNSTSNLDNDAPVKHEPALPEHQRDKQHETSQNWH